MQVVDWLRWACLSLHVVGVVVWVGGMIVQSRIVTPAMLQSDRTAKPTVRAINRRFLVYLWWSIAAVVVTGSGMTALHPEFGWFRWTGRESMLLGFKHLAVLVMIACAIGYTRMLLYMGSPSTNGGYDERIQLYQRLIVHYERISAVLGILAVVLAMAMVDAWPR